MQANFLHELQHVLLTVACLLHSSAPSADGMPPEWNSLIDAVRGQRTHFSPAGAPELSDVRGAVLGALAAQPMPPAAEPLALVDGAARFDGDAPALSHAGHVPTAVADAAWDSPHACAVIGPLRPLQRSTACRVNYVTSTSAYPHQQCRSLCW